ncbi:P-loop containing nucleoside triphosphate hydrolase protein [Russula brevipes]|nr:P-loop containing nucleoside triphosphate hydrolase protein [Russula brevipes]
MAKRRTVIDSDDEQDGNGAGPSSPKRTRLENKHQAENRSSKSKSKGKGKAKDDSDILNDFRVDDDDDIAAIRDTRAEEDDGAQERFEEEHEESVRESIRQRNRQQGGAAKFGIIEAIEMHHFMCHKFLTFKFGPQINFIIGAYHDLFFGIIRVDNARLGHNGSGKSAVLTAITVALGGKATSTGRGTGLKAFIREGQPAAEVTILLKNQGEEAYKHDLYGDSIVITRRFTKEGTSSYKIKSKDGKLISTKREELSAICDHMNIQVDNPMNVLTQDAARQFLSSSHPSDKYKVRAAFRFHGQSLTYSQFFLRGTQLSQLSEEYETCLENISQTSKVLMRKKEAIPDLQAHYKEVHTRFEEASKAREQRHKADELKKELAWAHVAAKQEEVTEKATVLHKAEQRIPKIQRSLDQADEKFKAATTAVETYEGEHETLGNIDHLMEKKKTTNESLRANKTKLSNLKHDERLISDNLKRTKDAMQKLEDRMAAEKARMAEFTQSKQDELTQRLQQATLAVQAAEMDLKQAEALVVGKKNEVRTLREQGDQTERETNDAKNSVMGLREQIKRCVEQKSNALAPYGHNLTKVLNDIGKTRWYGQKPLGPLGVYVKVKDRVWAGLLRIVLGSHMSSFAVTDNRDVPVLKKMLRECGNPNTNVFVSEVDLFDYRSGEPGPDYCTILRVLTGVNGGGQCLTADLWRVQRWSDGGGQSQPMHSLRANDPRNLLFTDKNAETQLRHWEQEAASADEKVQSLTSQLRELRERYNQNQREIEAGNGQCRGIHVRLNELRAKRDSLQTEANDNVLVETSGLEEALKEMIAEKESLMDQYKSIAEQRAVIDQAQEPLLKELNDVKKQIEDFDDRRQEAQTRVTQAAEQRLAAQNEQHHWAKKLLDEEKKLREAKEQLDVVQQEFEAKLDNGAEEYCARVLNPRKVGVVQRNLDSVQAALKEREKRQGASVEEMTAEVNKARGALETAQKDLKSMASLNRALKQSLRLRLEKWHDFRRHIAFRCKVVFQYHLSNRGYFGKVLFNHHDGMLQLKVQTDDQNSTQGGDRDKDPRSLSGGEKSFATICLLLAMWESIGSPIRCLDEFDVFMDAVNRRISMKMMIDTANSSDGKQYILITPQNMQNIHVGPTVRVHRMSDPERGQGTLAGGTSVA